MRLLVEKVPPSSKLPLSTASVPVLFQFPIKLTMLPFRAVMTPLEAIRAGADILVCHMGLTTGGAIGASSAFTLDDSARLINEMIKAARKIRDDIIILCHGGPIAEPADAEFILKHCPGCHGFYGASSMERLPVERALIEQTRKFKAIGGK